MRAHRLIPLSVLLCLLLTAVPVAADPPQGVGAPITQPFTVRATTATSDPIVLEPDQAWNASSLNILEQLFVGIVDLDDRSSEVRPELATWTISPDHLVYTFTLRSDAKWSDNRTLTAHDAVATLIRVLDPARQSEMAPLFFLIQNAEAYHAGTITNPAQVGIQALDNTHLRITLRQPASHFLAIMAHVAARPLPRHVIQTWGDNWTLPAHIVSSGAYVISEWVEGDHITLNKNPKFYDAANVQIERIIARRLDDAGAWQAYLDCELDTAPVPAGTPLDPFLQARVTNQSRGCTYTYGFNVSLPPFDRALVRKAFVAAVDRHGLARDVIGGGAMPAMTFVAAGIWGHVDGFSEGVGIPYNPAQARQWLADAGFPNGQGLPEVKLTFPNVAPHPSIADYVRQNWIDNLGVTVTLQGLPPAQWSQLVNSGQAQLYRNSWCPDYYDAANFLVDALGFRTPFGGWTSPEYENLLTLAAFELDPQARRALSKQAEEIVVEADAIMLPLYYYGVQTAAKSYLARTYPAFAPDVSEWQLLAWRVFLPVMLRNH